MRVLAWHVHGSWMTSFVQGRHEYLVPVLPHRRPDGRGRARTFAWPERVHEVCPQDLSDREVDVVVLQRPHERELLQRWAGLTAGLDVPALYVEHNTPRGDVDGWRHPLADQDRIPVVHVTEFNRAMWDCGRAPTMLIRHGVLDPGHLWSGERTTLAVCVNEPVRRRRVAGIDLAATVARVVPIEVYGMALSGLGELVPVGLAARHEDLPQVELHRRMATHRAYLHPYRWTSLGLALIEAMMLGLPVLVMSATAAPEAVPPRAGLVSSDPEALATRAAQLMRDRDLAEHLGQAARAHALAQFGITRFTADWDAALEEVCR